jgi:AraC-like DNA-binding protein
MLMALTGAAAAGQHPKLPPHCREPLMSECAVTPALCISGEEHSFLREKVFRAAANPRACASALPDLKIVHWFARAEPIEMMQGPCVLVVCAGKALVAMAGSIHPLRTGEQLVLCAPLDLQIEPESCTVEPLVLFALRLDLTVVAEMLLALKEPRRTLEETRLFIAFGPPDLKVAEAMGRLLDLSSSPCEAQILGPAIVREIHFRLLTGQHGAVMRAALGRNGRVAKVGRALRRIQNEFNTRLSAEVLAEETCMCLTSFHESFRAVTGTTPLQYLKTLRLNTARILMVRDGISAAAAAGRVGYDSPSQFSREFKRQFGSTPARLARDSGAPSYGNGLEATLEQPARLRRPHPRTGGAAATQVPAALGHGRERRRAIEVAWAEDGMI